MIASGRTWATADLVAAASRTFSTSGVAPAERILPSFDAERHVPVTSCPCSVSCRVRWVPTAPLAPMISTRMSLLLCPSRRRDPPCQCLRVPTSDTRRSEDVTSERRRSTWHRSGRRAGPRIRAAPAAPAGDRLPDARLAGRGRRRGAGDVGKVRRRRNRGRGNVSGWLTTIVTRACLNVLRARAARPEQPAGMHVPDPIAVHADDAALDPEQEALLAESVGLALMVVLDALTPAERVAFVLHDVFGVPFSVIGQLVGRSEQAARQQASRARRQVREAGPSKPDVGLPQQRAIVDAFFTAARAGDFDRLMELLDPDV